MLCRWYNLLFQKNPQGYVMHIKDAWIVLCNLRLINQLEQDKGLYRLDSWNYTLRLVI